MSAGLWSKYTEKKAPTPIHSEKTLINNFSLSFLQHFLTYICFLSPMKTVVQVQMCSKGKNIYIYKYFTETYTKQQLAKKTYLTIKQTYL